MEFDIASYLLGKKHGGIGVDYIVVEELPEIGESGIIYLVPKSTSETNNVYDEYMYINNDWELIGNTEADLSNYQPLLVSGTNIKTINSQSILGSGNLSIPAGAPLIYSEDRWELHLANDVEVGTYTTKESNIDLELYDLEETRWRITIPFGFFWVVKKYSEAQVGDVFLVFPTGNGFKSYKKTNDQYGFSTYGYTNTSVWTTKDYVDTKTNEIKVQYSTMPTASSTNVGQIVQYIGATDSTYTNGYFYECVSDGQSTPTYSWENVNVQASSGGGDDLPTTYTGYDATKTQVLKNVNGILTWIDE